MASFKVTQSVQGPNNLVFKTGYWILDAGTSSVTAWNDDPDMWRLIYHQQHVYQKNGGTAQGDYTAYLRDYTTNLQSFLHRRTFGVAITTGTGGYQANNAGTLPGEMMGGLVAAYYQFDFVVRDKVLVPAQTALIIAQSGANMTATTSTISWIESKDAKEILKLF